MTGIEWTDRSDWNPIRGCTRESEGCRNCYAEAIAARFSGPGQPFEGFAERAAGGPRWTGKVALIEDRLTLPLRWRKPALIFVNSAFDLFHGDVPYEWIDLVFRVIKQSPQHTFQILTKRAAKMRRYMTDPATPARVSFEARGEWPPRNAWLGVSAEDQRRADERVPELLATPAAVRFVSAEPLLGPIVMPLAWLRQGDNGAWPHDVMPVTGLDWIIVGGESGPSARPMHPDWPRAIRDQCAAAGVAFFFKQWGEWGDFDIRCDPSNRAVTLARPANDPLGRYVTPQGGSGIGHGTVWMRRVGKARAGRMLDGRTHDDMPARLA